MLSTITWNNPNGGSWSNTSNWSTSALPGPDDDVVIPALNNGAVVTHSDGGDTVNSINANGSVTVSGGNLNVTGDMTDAGALNLTGGMLTVHGSLLASSSVAISNATLAGATFSSVNTVSFINSSLVGVTVSTGTNIVSTLAFGVTNDLYSVT